MKKIIMMVAVAGLFASCVAVKAPIAGVLYTGLEANEAVTSNKLGTKVGTSSAKAILGVAFGNASVQEAAKSAGITKISHVDTRVESVLGVYGKYEIVVYGD